MRFGKYVLIWQLKLMRCTLLLWDGFSCCGCGSKPRLFFFPQPKNITVLYFFVFFSLANKRTLFEPHKMSRTKKERKKVDQRFHIQWVGTSSRQRHHYQANQSVVTRQTNQWCLFANYFQSGKKQCAILTSKLWSTFYSFFSSAVGQVPLCCFLNKVHHFNIN